jgi:hypothetical protein
MEDESNSVSGVALTVDAIAAAAAVAFAILLFLKL